MATISQIVSQITESLSEGISGLTLFVLVSKENNTTLPPNLPNAVEGVVKSCSVLAQVARKLSSDYADYSRIQKKLIKASNELEESNLLLASSLKLLSSVERVEGWQILNDACKSIAERVIELLQIVYGAEVERILELSEQTRELLASAKNSLESIAQNVKPFGTWTGKVANSIDKLSVLASARAADEASPFSKKALLDAAKLLQGSFDKLLALANKVAQNPLDKSLQQAYLDELKSIEDAIGAITDTTRAKILDSSDFARAILNDDEVLLSSESLSHIIPTIMKLAQKVIDSPENLEYQEELKRTLENVQSEVRAIMASSGVDHRSIKIKIDEMMAKLLPIVGAKFDMKNLFENAQNLSNSLQELIHAAKEAAKKNKLQKESEEKAAKRREEEERVAAEIDAKEREKGAKSSVEDDSLNDLLKGLEKLGKNIGKPKEEEDKEDIVIAPNATLDEIATILQKEAAKMRNRATVTKASISISNGCDSIAADLALLAAASKNGKGSNIVACARSIAVKLAVVYSEAMRIANNTSDARLADKLIRNAQAVKNFGTQLKILASVSASSNSKGDTKLVAMASNIGRMLNETMNSAKAAEITLKK